MKKSILMALLFVVISCTGTAWAESKINSSADQLISTIQQAYNGESPVLLNKILWFNSPGKSEIVERSNYEFSTYDTICLVIKPLSTVFYERMGYDRVDLKVIEEFRGVNVNNGTLQETISQTTLRLFRDETGKYYILFWKRIPVRPMIKINKE